MKAILIESKDENNYEIVDSTREEAFSMLLSEFDLMESPIIYFSAGDAKIKEILVKKTPTFSA